MCNAAAVGSLMRRFALLPIGPRLDVRFHENRVFSPQSDEFPLSWERVYSTALQPEDVEASYPGAVDAFDGFWSWLFEHACPPPLKLAVEAKPFELLVCARKCRADHVPVLKFEWNGTRVRECSKM